MQIQDSLQFNMSPKQEQNLTIANKIMIAWGIPLILGMLSLITFFVHDIYRDYKERMESVERKVYNHETRIVVLESWQNQK